MKVIMFILLLPLVGTATNNDAASRSHTTLYQYLMIKSFLNRFYSPVSNGKTSVHAKGVIPAKSENKIGENKKMQIHPDSAIVRRTENPTYQHSYTNRRIDQEDHSVLIFLKKVTDSVIKPKDNRIIDEFLKLLINA